ncbi:hypothetical protein ACTGYO_11145, partial [Streptococcus suis]
MTLTLALLLAGQVAASPSEPSAPPSPAQEAEAAQAKPAPQTQSGDIVVTARRRAESVQRVPIAMSVIGGADIDKTGAF